jgi:O-antigen/teichoic acid export membrane protein
MKEKFAVQMGLNLSLQVIGLIVVYLKSSLLDVEIVGIMQMANYVANLFTMFLDLGISAIHFQYSSKKDFNKYLGSFLVLKIFLIIVNYSIPIIYLIFNDFDPALTQLIYLNLVSGVFVALAIPLQINLQSRMKIMKKEFTHFSIQSINYILQIYICLNLANYPNPAYSMISLLMYINIIRFIVFFLINLNESLFFKPDWQKMKEYIKDAKPLIIQSVISVLNSYVGVIIVGAQSGYTELAYYSFVNLYIINILVSITMSVSDIFSSIFPKMFAEKKYKTVEIIANQFEKYVSLFFIAVIFFIQLNCYILFKLLLPAYIPSVNYLRWLILVPFLDATLRPYMGNLTQAKKQEVGAKIGIFNIVLGLILQIVFVSNTFFGLGAWGLIIITLIMSVFNNFIYRYFSRKYFGIRSNVKHLYHIVAGLSAYGISYFGMELIFKNMEEGIIWMGLSTIIFAVAYIIILYSFKQISKEDITLIKGLLNPSNYLKSFKEESNANGKKENEEINTEGEIPLNN